MEVSLYLAHSGDLGHNKDCGKAMNSRLWRIQNDEEISLYTWYLAQEHPYSFVAKVQLTAFFL